MSCTSSHRVLRSFWSHKNIKSEEPRQYQAQHLHMHSRQPSQATSVSSIRSSSEESRPSTSRTVESSSSDWNPLRSHPPMNTARSPYIQPSHSLDSTTPPHSPRRHHFEHDSTSDVQTLRHQVRSFRDLQASSTTSSEIHDGFNFGFNSNDATPVPAAYRPEPKSAWSAWSSSTMSRRNSIGSDGAPESMWADAVVPRPHRRSRTDFLKRGQWKRRGIVFAPEVAMATEEDCFDLP